MQKITCTFLSELESHLSTLKMQAILCAKAMSFHRYFWAQNPVLCARDKNDKINRSLSVEMRSAFCPTINLSAQVLLFWGDGKKGRAHSDLVWNERKKGVQNCPWYRHFQEGQRETWYIFSTPFWQDKGWARPEYLISQHYSITFLIAKKCSFVKKLGEKSFTSQKTANCTEFLIFRKWH